MSYVEKNLVPGETLLYQTRHHWIVLIGPVLMALLVGLPGLLLLFAAADKNARLDMHASPLERQPRPAESGSVYCEAAPARYETRPTLKRE